MTKLSDLKAEFLKISENRVAYDALGPEFDRTNQMIAASTASDLSQTVRMKPNTCRKH